MRFFAYLCAECKTLFENNKNDIQPMKFVIQSTELYARLQILGRVIASKNNLPILDGILLRPKAARSS